MLRECLKVLHKQEFPFESEIIVVDNSPSEGLERKLKEQFPRVIYMSSQGNEGFARANNRGIGKAQGEYLLILNPDCIVMPLSIHTMIEYLDLHPDTGIVAPQLLNPDGSIQYSCHQFPTWYMPLARRTLLGNTSWGKDYIRDYDMEEWDHTTVKDIDWAMGACLLVRTELIREVGGFDERYFLYFEDTDLCKSFWKRGYKVTYIPQAKVFHFHERASKGLPTLLSIFNPASRAHIASWVKYFLKYRLTK